MDIIRFQLFNSMTNVSSQSDNISSLRTLSRISSCSCFCLFHSRVCDQSAYIEPKQITWKFRITRFFQLATRSRFTGKMMDGRSLPIGYPIITSAILKAVTLKRDNQRSVMALPLKYCKYRAEKSMSHCWISWTVHCFWYMLLYDVGKFNILISWTQCCYWNI